MGRTTVLVPTARKRNEMLLSLQALRFLAAFGVLFHHVISDMGSKISVFGAGVDLFFVISGFVISYSTREHETWREFAAKRLIRVFPIYWIATGVYIYLHWYYWQDLPDFQRLITSLFLIPTLGTHWFPIYFAGWTLVYECAFYLLFASAMILTPRHYRILCICVLLSLAAVLIPSPVAGVYLSSDLLLEFVFGMLIAEVLPYLRKMDGSVGLLLVAGSLVVFAYNYGGMTPNRPLAWGIPAAMMIAGTLRFDDLSFFKAWIVRTLGGASYSIYLFHLTTIHWIEVWYGRERVEIKATPLLAAFLFISASIAVGVTVHLFVEKPVMNLLRSLVFPYLSSMRARSEAKALAGGRRALAQQTTT